MVRFLILAALLIAPTYASAFDNKTVEHVQQSLIELGLEPGPVDGAWGGKTRRALNALRLKNEMPESKALVGSSLALIHKLHPTDRTLPRPGQLQTDAGARRSYLLKHPAIAEEHCGNGWGAPTLGIQPRPVKWLTGKVVPTGKLSSNQDWFSEIGTRIAVEAAACQAGDDKSCLKVVDSVYEWAKSDSLQSQFSRSSKRFDEIQWVAGSMLRPMLTSYATARQLVEVPTEQDALIIDWLVSRATYYYLPERRTPREFKNQDVATNHQVSSALLYAMAGALIGDRIMFEAGLAKWDEAIASLREDGSFPTETQRGAWSLSYTGLQLNYMIGLAELARHQEVVLDDVGNLASRIHDAARFHISAMENYDIIEGYALRNASSNDSNPKMPVTTAFEEMLGWMPYLLTVDEDKQTWHNIAELDLDDKICSAQQIQEGKATKWKCTEIADEKRPLKLAHMLEGAMMGHFNAGHIGACTHADRINYFDTDSEIVGFKHSEWAALSKETTWQPAKPVNQTFGTEILNSNSWDDGRGFNIWMGVTKLTGANKGAKFRLNLEGRASFMGRSDLNDIKIILNGPVSKATAQKIAMCGANVGFEDWDGNLLPSISSVHTSVSTQYGFKNADCLISELPSNYKMNLKVLFSGFATLIGDFVRSGDTDSLKNEHLEQWMLMIANGERSVAF